MTKYQQMSLISFQKHILRNKVALITGSVTGLGKRAAIELAKDGIDIIIARVIQFLCKEDSGFITGSVISVTGGKDVLSNGSGK